MATKHLSFEPLSPEYQAICKSASVLIDLVKESPITIATTLFAEGILSPYKFNLVGPTSKMSDIEKGQLLVNAIADHVKANPACLSSILFLLRKEGQWVQSFLKQVEANYHFVLEQAATNNQPSDSDSYYSATEGETSDDDASFRKVKSNSPASATGFISPFCSKCSIKTFFSETGCPHAAERNANAGKLRFPYLDCSTLTPEEKEILESHLIDDTKEIIGQFADTEDSLIGSFESQNVDPKRLANYVLHLLKKIEMKEEKKEIKKANSISEVFLALHPFKSFLHYEVIENIAKKFGNQKDGELMDEYVSKFYKYCKRSAFEVPPKIFHDSKPKPDEKFFTVVLTEEFPTLNDVVSVRRKLAKVLDVPLLSLRLYKIEPGSVKLTFLLPRTLAAKIFPITPSKIAILQEIHITIFSQPIDQLLKYPDSTSAESDLEETQKRADDKCQHSPLLAACEGGHTETVKLLIDKGVDVNECDEFGQSPLSVACKKGHTEIAQLLIDKGAIVKEEAMFRQSPLLAACEGGHTETVKLLIDKGVDVNECDEFKQSPLVAACEGGHTETAQLLIDKGADVNKKSLGEMCYQSPLLAACKGGHSETVLLLIDKGADINNYDQFGQWPLYVAIEKGHTETAELMINQGANVKEILYGRTYQILLLGAIKEGHSKTAQLLIDKQTDVNKHDEFEKLLLLVACGRGHTESAQMLIDKGIDVNNCNQYEQTSLMAACEGGHTGTAQMLIDKGADMNKRDKFGQSPLLIACKGGHTETAQLLIDKGVNIKMKMYRRLLVTACEGGHIDTVQWLINKGVDVNKCDKAKTPLMAATQSGNIDVVKLLIDNGADVNESVNAAVEVPLGAACVEGHTEIAELLIDKGADVNKCDEMGNSLLMTACAEGRTATAQLLIEKGADVNMCNKLGFSPLFIAQMKGFKPLVGLLEPKKTAKRASYSTKLKPYKGTSSVSSGIVTSQVESGYGSTLSYLGYDSDVTFSGLPKNKPLKALHETSTKIDLTHGDIAPPLFTKWTDDDTVSPVVPMKTRVSPAPAVCQLEPDQSQTSKQPLHVSYEFEDDRGYFV